MSNRYTAYEIPMELASLLAQLDLPKGTGVIATAEGNTYVNGGKYKVCLTADGYLAVEADNEAGAK